MACIVCGTEKTVRSHIVPKAFAHEVRGGARHVISGSRLHIGAKPSQGGAFSDNLLCSVHEGKTGVADKYGVEFVRRITETWRTNLHAKSLDIPNPRPNMLVRFALVTIWREVQFVDMPDVSLGPHEKMIQDFVFHEGDAPDWPILVQRTNFQLPSGVTVDFNLHPYPVKFASRKGWAFTVAGAGFFVISDRRSLPSAFDHGRADMHDPALVTVSEPLPITDVGSLKAIFANMARKNSRRQGR